MTTKTSNNLAYAALGLTSPLFISGDKPVKKVKHMTVSIKTLSASYLASIPADKQGWGWVTVVVPTIGSYLKSNSQNGAKSVVLPGGFVVKPTAVTGGSKKSPFMGSQNIAVIRDGKLFIRKPDEMKLSFRLTSLTDNLLQSFKEAESKAPAIDSFQKMLINQRGQLHILCLDTNQAKVVTPKVGSTEEVEEFVVHPQNVYKIIFVTEDNPNYIHRVDMPAHINSRNWGEEVELNSKPVAIDAFAARGTMNARAIKRAIQDLIAADPEFLRSATLEQVQEKVGSTKKEVNTFLQEFLATVGATPTANTVAHAAVAATELTSAAEEGEAAAEDLCSALDAEMGD